MNRSVVILLTALWLFAAVYGAIARVNNYPYGNVALIASWVLSLLLLVCVVIYIRKHAGTMKNKK